MTTHDGVRQRARSSQAFREVERDLSLPSNWLVDETPLPKISGEVRLKSMVILLDRNFITRVPDNFIRHSKELIGPIFQDAILDLENNRVYCSRNNSLLSFSAHDWLPVT